ncbi:MAG: hypothetical protein HY216_10145 [Candidatus Rokubacteria bacterium]|nr:hypothetical protein [Candidatus Rokubacteria bacterium]
MRSLLLSLTLLAAVVMPATAGEPVSQAFNAAAERVWAVTQSVLKSRGWDIDKVDRIVGWLVTDSRSLEGGDYGVYAKGTRHRLRFEIKPTAPDSTTVTVERTVFKRERILWMDKDEPVPTTDQSVEKQLLADIGRAL